MNNMEKEAKLKVYYDGLCKVCHAEMDHYKKQSGSEKIEFMDIFSTLFEAEKEGLNPADIHKVMHVRRLDGSLATKVDAFIEIWKVLPKYKRLAAIAKNPMIRSVLDLSYNLFTKIRPWLPRTEASADCSSSPYCEVKNG